MTDLLMHLTPEQQRLAIRVTEAQEGVRRAVAEELHREIGQRLMGVNLLLELERRHDTESGSPRLDQVHGLIQELIDYVRTLSLDLNPVILHDLGLVPALQWQFERYTARTHVHVQFEYLGIEHQRFSTAVETVVYRLIEEAFANVARHANVTTVTVRLTSSPHCLRLQIEDAGPDAVFVSQTPEGLREMQAWVTLLDGTLTLDARPGQGTCVTVDIPGSSSR